MNHDCNSNWWWGWQQRQSPSGMTRVITPLNNGIWSGRVTTVAQGINRAMLWGPKNVKVKPMTMNTKYCICSSLCRVLFLSYPTNDHVPSFVGKRCQAQTLLSKQLSHLLSLSKHFSEKGKQEYTHPRDLWLITILLCYLIIFTLIIIINWSYSYSYSVEKRRLLSISSIN